MLTLLSNSKTLWTVCTAVICGYVVGVIFTDTTVNLVFVSNAMVSFVVNVLNNCKHAKFQIVVMKVYIAANALKNTK